MQRRPTSLILIVLSALLLPVAFSQGAGSGQVLNYGASVREIATLDPHYSTGYIEYGIIGMLYNGLVRFPPGSTDLDAVEADLATDWTVSEDGLTYTFDLRDDVVWHHDYGPFTAADVVFSLNRVRGEEAGSPWRAAYANVTSVEAQGDHQVVITLERPDPFFVLALVGHQGGAILSEAAVTEKGDAYSLDPVGTGPFMLQNYQERQGVTLAANADYFRGEPVLERIEVRFMPDVNSRVLALQSGELHMIDGEADQLWVDQMEAAGFAIDLFYPGQLDTLFYNMSREPLSDLRVRQALSYAVDRQEIIDYFGPTIAEAAYSPVPPGYFGYTLEGVERYEHDPDRARELLAEAGYPNGVTISASSSESFLYLPLFQILQAQWQRVGVTLELQVVDHPTYHTLIRDNANDVVAYAAARSPIADRYLTEFYHSDSIIGTPTAVTNFSHYGGVDADGDGEVDSIDDLIERARVSLDTEEQLELYAQAQQELTANAASLPLITLSSVFVRVPELQFEEGFLRDGKFTNLYEWYILNENTRFADE